MAGGNSHQRGVERAKQARIDKQISAAINKAISKQSSVSNGTEPLEVAEKADPWYERGLFWGCLSLAAAIVLTVIAAMQKDLRWLLFVAWPLSLPPFWLMSRGIRHLGLRWILFLGLSCGAAVGLFQFERLALKPEPQVITPQPTDLTGIQKGLDEINRHLSEAGSPKISETQTEALREVDQFIGEPDEMTLREEFGLNEMMRMNIKLVQDMVANSKGKGPRSEELLHYAQDKESMLVADRLGGHLSRRGGAFQLTGDASTVFQVVLPFAYSSTIRRLGKLEASSELPTSVIQALKNFDTAIISNVEMLARVEDDALKKDPNYFLLYDDSNSPFFHEIDALYFRKFVLLRPKADKVRDSVRKFRGVN
jgi:hypothetical protein